MKAKAQKLARKFKDKLTKTLSMAILGKKNNNACNILFIADYAELIKYCGLIINNKFEKAFLMQQEMDTDLYESIPDQLYFLIEKISEEL